jgi:hypothetical protein
MRALRPVLRRTRPRTTGREELADIDAFVQRVGRLLVAGNAASTHPPMISKLQSQPGAKPPVHAE